MYLSGHLHRDVSLGNVLMTDKPAERKKFEIPKEFQDHVASLGQNAADMIGGLCRRVEELVVKLRISNQCTGFVTDGNLAISWDNYWDMGRRAAKSVSHPYVTRKVVCLMRLTGHTRVHVPGTL